MLSISHLSSASLLSEDDWQELAKFKEALREFFDTQGQAVCFTERHYKSSHLQINVLGIDKGYAWKIKHAFEVFVWKRILLYIKKKVPIIIFRNSYDKAEEFNLQFETLPALKSPQMLPQQGPYFVAELPDKTMMITRQMHFPIHFASDVFCLENLLNCEEKVDWKQCKLEKEEEIEMVNSFLRTIPARY